MEFLTLLLFFFYSETASYFNLTSYNSPYPVFVSTHLDKDTSLRKIIALSCDALEYHVIVTVPVHQGTSQVAVAGSSVVFFAAKLISIPVRTSF